MNLLSVVTALIYILVLVGSFATFSSLYRKRKAAKAASLEPWFGPHTPRDVYMTLLHLEGEKQVPDGVLKAALLLRAKEDIRRVVILRGQKQGLQQLLQRGSVGDDLWTRFQAAEAEMDEELRDVVTEANAYRENWGQYIFQCANEMVQADKVHERAALVEAQAQQEREWWDKKRERASRELLGESGEEEDGVIVDAPGKKGKKK